MKTIKIKDNTKHHGIGMFGRYYKLTSKRGVKVLDKSGKFLHLKNLIGSPAWQEALDEAANLEKAYPSGISPKCYGVVPVYRHGLYLPGVVMEHIDAVPFRDTEFDWIDRQNIGHQLNAMLKKHGILHNDLNDGNILVRRNWKNEPLFCVVDFGPNSILEVA